METLVSEADSISYSIPSETTDEIELAILASLEEEYTSCSVQWDKFQMILHRLKRIGNYDKQVMHLYELLSLYLYKYSYRIYEPLSEESYQFIKTQLKGIRLTKEEENLLVQGLNRLRFGL